MQKNLVLKIVITHSVKSYIFLVVHLLSHYFWREREHGRARVSIEFAVCWAPKGGRAKACTKAYYIGSLCR